MIRLDSLFLAVTLSSCSTNVVDAFMSHFQRDGHHVFRIPHRYRAVALSPPADPVIRDIRAKRTTTREIDNQIIALGVPAMLGRY